MTAKALHHKFWSPRTDGSDTTLIRPSNWNADHDLWLGYRDVVDETETIGHDDHLSVLSFSYPTGAEARLLAPAGDDFPVGWRVRLYNAAALGQVRVIGQTCTINGRAEIGIRPTETLDIHSTGTPDYIGVKIPVADRMVDGGRLSFRSQTQLRFDGRFFKHNGLLWPCSAVGGLTNTNVVITGAGGSENLLPSTVYWVFAMPSAGGRLVANFRSAAQVGTHRPSTRTPENEGTEVLYVGSSDTEHDTHTLIGMVRTDNNAQFMDAPTGRFVASWLNRRPRGLTSAAMGGVGTSGSGVDPATSYISFVNWADDPVWAALTQGMTVNNTAGTSNWVSVGLDGGAVFNNASTQIGVAGVAYAISNMGHLYPGEGYHYAHPWIGTSGSTGYFHGRVEASVFS